MTQKNNLLRNASFLMIAALISKVIGLLYKSPLSEIVGEIGIGYYGLAQNAYLILLMIASFSIPQAVSKVIAERLAFKEYKNAQKFFRGALIYTMILSGASALFCLFGAKYMIPSNQPGATLALQVLAPTIFLSGILGVYRGYFQAHSKSSMQQSALGRHGFLSISFPMEQKKELQNGGQQEELLEPEPVY